MAEYTNLAKDRESNYDKFKRDALIRFLTYNQEDLIRRLNLKYDETYIYVPFCSRDYRIHRQEPIMEKMVSDRWEECSSNAVLTICDLLCHTERPLQLSGVFTTLGGLNRVKGGSSQTTLGESFFGNTEKYFDEHVQELATACEKLGGIPMGKGDVAYRIPIFESVALLISFYESDDEFPAQLTFFLDQDICEFLFFETLWYMIGMIMEEIQGLMSIEGEQ